VEQNCWIKGAVVVIMLLAGAMTLLGAQPQTRTHEPEKLVLPDEKGNERVWLGMGKEGPVLRFRDEGGKERLWLGLAKNTPGLVLYDQHGKRRAGLSTGTGDFCRGCQEKARRWASASATVSPAQPHNGVG
jgi:hypothetical protein